MKTPQPEMAAAFFSFRITRRVARRESCLPLPSFHASVIPQPVPHTQALPTKTKTKERVSRGTSQALEKNFLNQPVENMHLVETPLSTL